MVHLASCSLSGRRYLTHSRMHNWKRSGRTAPQLRRFRSGTPGSIRLIARRSLSLTSIGQPRRACFWRRWIWLCPTGSRRRCKTVKATESALFSSATRRPAKSLPISAMWRYNAAHAAAAACSGFTIPPHSTASGRFARPHSGDRYWVRSTIGMSWIAGNAAAPIVVTRQPGRRPKARGCRLPRRNGTPSRMSAPSIVRGAGRGTRAFR